MTRIFPVFAGLDFVALLAAFALGVLSRWRVGAWHPQDPTYVIHYVVGLAAVFGNLFVHCVLVLTYFLGTGRWVKEVTLAYGLPDERWARPTRDLKRSNTPKALLAMGLAIATAAAGEADQHQVWPWWVHLALACLTVGVNAWVCVVEYRNMVTNSRILDEVMREVDRIRAEHGLPTSAEALRQEEE
jgi:hypothetical protein